MHMYGQRLKMEPRQSDGKNTGGAFSMPPKNMTEL